MMQSMKKNPPPPKSQRLFDNLSKVILEFMGGTRYEPLGQLALFKRLKLPNIHLPLFKEVIIELIKKDIVQLKNKRLSLKVEEPETIPGTLRMHPRGFGFLIPDNPAQCPQDVFIPKHLTENAVDGDKVEVLINPNSNWDKGPEGKIVNVVKRSRTHLAGTVYEVRGEQALIYVPLLGNNKPVAATYEKEPKVGDRVIIEVEEWSESQGQETVGVISHTIGHINNPAYDIPAAIEEYDLKDTFSKKSIKEAKSFGKEVTKKDIKGRLDFTKSICITIDPETAKDFDDALSLTKDRKGHYHLGVHIADVAHYIPANSALDLDAQERCNSTYFPGRVVPMLPEELSNELCSLKPNVIRLTVSVFMEFDKNGTLLKHEIVRAAIKSRKRFSYEEAKLVLDKKKKSPHAKILELMVELCLLLKKKRHERGSIDFAMPEFVIITDTKGNPVGTKWVEYDITHQLVEEYMLKANEVVAKDITDRGKTPLYRVHEEPSEENMKDFFAMARTLGFSLSEKPEIKEIQALFEKAKKTTFVQQLSVSFIRSMKLAFYSPENVGHYGLSLEHYCHFTSPIRRYSDTITQRLLFDEEDVSMDLKKIALKCSDQERLSFKAETSVKLLKKLRLLKTYLKEDPSRIYEVVTTKIKPFGLFFEFPGLMIEGFLHISELEDDYFVYQQERNILKGRSSGKVHAVGEKLNVHLLSVDLIFLETKWSLVNARKKKRRK